TLIVAAFLAGALAAQVGSRIGGAIGAFTLGAAATLLFLILAFSEFGRFYETLLTVPGWIANGIGGVLSVAVFYLLRPRSTNLTAGAIAVGMFGAWWAVVAPTLTFRIALILGAQLASGVGVLGIVTWLPQPNASLADMMEAIAPLGIEAVRSDRFGG